MAIYSSTAQSSATSGADGRPGGLRLGWNVALFVSLAGVSMAITLMYLMMRSVMAVGGSCADGGPYVSAQPCPNGTGTVVMIAVFGGIVSVLLFIGASIKLKAPMILLLGWPALFISLGWNFLEFGLNPPPGLDEAASGWIVCGVVFEVMGAGPLLFLIPLFIQARRNRRNPDWLNKQSRAIDDLMARTAHTGPTRALVRGASRASGSPVDFNDLRTHLKDLMDAANQARGAAAGTPFGAAFGSGTVFNAGTVIDGRTGATLTTDPSVALGLVDQLQRLAVLRSAGSLTEQEFAAAKQALLSGLSSPTGPASSGPTNGPIPNGPTT